MCVYVTYFISLTELIDNVSIFAYAIAICFHSTNIVIMLYFQKYTFKYKCKIYCNTAEKNTFKCKRKNIILLNMTKWPLFTPWSILGPWHLFHILDQSVLNGQCDQYCTNHLDFQRNFLVYILAESLHRTVLTLCGDASITLPQWTTVRLWTELIFNCTPVTFSV